MNTRAHAIRQARSRRARSIRRFVVTGAVTLFVAVWALIAIEMATGHDPALSARKSSTVATVATVAQATTTTTPQTTTTTQPTTTTTTQPTTTTTTQTTTTQSTSSSSGNSGTTGNSGTSSVTTRQS